MILGSKAWQYNIYMFRRKLTKDEIKLLPLATRDIFVRFMKADKEIYLVGAGVRSILKGETPRDCDFTTNAVPEEIIKIMQDWEPFYDNIYGTVGVSVKNNDLRFKNQDLRIDEVYEITPYRTERGYSDVRRPDEVEWGESLEEDVKRRDFTMNAVVIGPVKDSMKATEVWYELIDYLEGLKDFEQGTIRAVGEAKLRFAEDALRMMRAIRFAAQLGFVIEEETLSGIKENAPLLEKISKERVRDELKKILKSQYPADGVHLLMTTGLMEYIMPEVLETKNVAQTGHHVLDVYSHMLESLRGCPSSDPIVRLATFLHDIGKPKTRRLRCIKCGWVMKEVDKQVAGETAVMTQYKCPRCGTQQSEHEAGTFYGHEVVGARMVGEIAQRLRFSKKEKEKMVTLVRWHMFSYNPQMTDASIRRFIKRIGMENINDMMLLRIGDRKGGGSRTTSWRLQELQRRIGEQLYQPMTINDLVIDGRDVMKILGIKPGPKVGQVLKELFEEVIEDTSKNTKEYLEKRVKATLS